MSCVRNLMYVSRKLNKMVYPQTVQTSWRFCWTVSKEYLTYAWDGRPSKNSPSENRPQSKKWTYQDSSKSISSGTAYMSPLIYGTARPVWTVYTKFCCCMPVGPTFGTKKLIFNTLQNNYWPQAVQRSNRSEDLAHAKYRNGPGGCCSSTCFAFVTFHNAHLQVALHTSSYEACGLISIERVHVPTKVQNGLKTTVAHSQSHSPRYSHQMHNKFKSWIDNLLIFQKHEKN